MLNALRKIFEHQTAEPYHRRWSRIVMTQPARVGVRREELRSALLDNISAGGACVQVAERLAPGALVAIDFATGPSDRHSLYARVIHAAKERRGFNWHCGLCFVDVNPAESQAIAAYVEEEGKRRKVGFAMPRT